MPSMGLLFVIFSVGGCATLSTTVQDADDGEYTTDIDRFVWATQDISKPALEEALKDFNPSGGVRSNTSSSEEDSAVLEYAMDYALEYALQCALDDIMQNSPEEALGKLSEYPLKNVFSEAFEFSHDYVLEENLASFSENAIVDAYGLAFEFGRNRAFDEALDYALAGVTVLDLKEALNEELSEALEEAFASAFETVLAKATAQIPSIWPVEHPKLYISSAFGAVRRSLGGVGRLHKGIDIVAPRGLPVFATANGVVECAERGRGYGLMVKIKHTTGYASLYAHLDSFSVKEGDEVVCGQEIGKLGATGNASCPHVHYEVHQNEKLIDPELFLPAR